MTQDVTSALDAVYRSDWGRIVAPLRTPWRNTSSSTGTEASVLATRRETRILFTYKKRPNLHDKGLVL